jgi:hypothetical protein
MPPLVTTIIESYHYLLIHAFILSTNTYQNLCFMADTLLGTRQSKSNNVKRLMALTTGNPPFTVQCGPCQ